MSAGAAGVAVRISGKIGSEISRVEKFSSGYLKYSGDVTETIVKTAYAQANVKLGMIGIQVRILPMKPEELEIMSNAEKIGEKIGNNKEEAAKSDE